MAQCLKTQLKEVVDTLLPQIGIVKFHPPYNENFGQTERSLTVGSYGSNTLLKTTGTFSNGRNYLGVPADQKTSTYFSNEAGGSIVSIENYYDIFDLLISEALAAGIKGDANLDSLLSVADMKRLVYRDMLNQGGNKNFLMFARTLIAFYYNCGAADTKQGDIVSEVIKNNPNLRYVEINATATAPLIEEVRNLDLIQDYRGWIGNVENVGVGVRRKDINTAKDYGNLQILVNRLIAAGRTSGAILVSGLLYADNVRVGAVTGRAFCISEGVSANPVYITWDSAGTIHATSTQPQEYVAPDIGIYSSDIEAIIYQ